jgi:hypothetical protein
MKLQIPSKKITTWLFGLTLGLNLFGFAARIIEKLMGYNNTEFVRLVDVGEEANITSWFSSFLLLLSALLLYLISRLIYLDNGPFAKHWTFLSYLFIFLSIDETATIHEMLIKPLRVVFHSSGIFYYAWMIIAIPSVLLLAILYLRFVFSLPINIRNQFILSVIIFLAGALGFEMLGGLFFKTEISGIHVLSFLITFEELLENLGVVVFISALLTYIRMQSNWKNLVVEVV